SLPRMQSPPAWVQAGGYARPGEARRSDASHVGGVEPLGAGLNLELDDLALRQGLEAVHLNGGEMYEDVFAALLLNEAIAFGVIEPLNLPSGHASCLLRGDSLPHKTGAVQTAVVCGPLYRWVR